MRKAQSSELAAFRIEADGTLAPLGEVLRGPQGAQAVQIVYVPR